MWVGIQAILGKPAGEADTGIAISTLRTSNGKCLILRRGIENYDCGRALAQAIDRNAATNETFDAEFDKEIDAWAEANVDAPEREGSNGSEGLHRVHKARSKERFSYT